MPNVMKRDLVLFLISLSIKKIQDMKSFQVGLNNYLDYAFTRRIYFISF